MKSAATENPGRPPRGVTVLLVFLGFALALAIAEAGVRVLAAPPERGPFMTCQLEVVARDGVFSYRPGQECFQCYTRREAGRYGDELTEWQGEPVDCIRYRIGSHGFRTPPFDHQRAGARILAVGDSFTFGEGVREEDTWPRVLAATSGVEVVNLGVQGSNSRFERFTVEKFLGLEPAVVIVGFVLNDVMPHGETVRRYEDQESLFWLPALLQYSRLVTHLHLRWARQRASRRTLEDYRTWFERGWPKAAEDLQRMNRAAENHQSRFLIVVFPLLFRLGEGTYPFMENHERIERFARNAGIPHLDLLEAYSRVGEERLQVHPLDPHPNALAHRIAAHEILARLRAGGVLPASAGAVEKRVSRSGDARPGNSLYRSRGGKGDS